MICSVHLSQFKPNGPQLQVIAGYAPKIYGAALPDDITPARLEHDIEDYLRAEATTRGKTVDEYRPFKTRPRRDSCRRFIKQWREFYRSHSLRG